MKRYLLIIVTLTLGFCLMVGLFNYKVDPSGIFHLKQVNADSLSRIDQFLHMRITKPWYVVQQKPTAIVLGTSRSATVPPQHSTWPQDLSYNLSVPGLTVYEMRRFIEHAQANRSLDKLMIGLDFEAFILPEPLVRKSFEESRMARNADDLLAPRFIGQLLSDARDKLLSLPGFVRSVSALTGTGKEGRRYFKDGTWVSTTSAVTGKGGYIYVGKMNVFDLRNEQLSLDANLNAIADILRFAHQQEIDTRLFITPEHVFMIDLWWRIGFGELWSDFHRRLVVVNDTVASEMGAKPFPIVGFNHVRGVVDEPISTIRRPGLSIFTDGIHFRPSLGKQIMDGVWSEGDSGGFSLKADSVGAYLSVVEQLRHKFEADNAQLTAVLRHEISPELN